ncbi:MAG: hypothetical protein PHD48_01970 [Alphaproteobacteria bacterium]|nr:hypothetical protein [Alphaproteobacteria bacterium]
MPRPSSCNKYDPFAELASEYSQRILAKDLKRIEEILTADRDMFAPWKAAFNKENPQTNGLDNPFPDTPNPINIYLFLDQYLVNLLSPDTDEMNVVKRHGETTSYLSNCKGKHRTLLLLDLLGTDGRPEADTADMNTMEKIPLAIKKLQLLAREAREPDKSLCIGIYKTLDQLITTSVEDHKNATVKKERGPITHPFHPSINNQNGDGLYLSKTGMTYINHGGKTRWTIKFRDLCAH